MKKLERFLIAIAFALLVAGATFMIARAKVEPVVPVQAQPVLAQPALQQPDCLACHSQFNDAWSAGAHGHSMTDTKFVEMWTDQGKPGACLVCHATGYDPATGTVKNEAVSCLACHTEAPAAHATSPSANPVPVDRTNGLCARCHSDARFGLEQWQTSAHYQSGMTCTVCHDPHTAALKTVAGMEDKGPSGLCINCHSEVSMKFPYSKHNQKGVSCVDCHLRHFGTQDTEDVHAMPDHSFTASLDTCNSCHSDQMHMEGAAVVTITAGTPEATIQPEATPAVEPVADKPAPVSPAGFAGLAGLLGLAGGMVLQPWLEKLYRQVNGKKGEKK